VTSNLTRHYERKIYILTDNPQDSKIRAKYVDVYRYPDGDIEIRAAGESLPTLLTISWARSIKVALLNASG
jgi:hypothetical protein